MSIKEFRQREHPGVLVLAELAQLFGSRPLARTKLDHGQGQSVFRVSAWLELF